MAAHKRALVMQRVYDLLEVKEAERARSQREAENADDMLPVKQEKGPEATVTAAQSQSSDSSQAEPTQPPRKKQRRSLADRLAGDVTDLTRPADNLRKEVSDYISAMVRAGVSPLEWWSRHSCGFQNVADLAREYLSIPPTEVRVSNSWLDCKLKYEINYKLQICFIINLNNLLNY